MTPPDTRPVDWAAVFSSAHRRVALRLAAVAAVGAAGAVLLLSAGGATRAAIQTDDSGGSTGGGEVEQPYLSLSASAVDGGEDGEGGEEESGGGEVEFSVVDESGVDADEFTVVATASSGEAMKLPFPPLAAHEMTTGSFACSAGDVLTIEIESSQPHDEEIEVNCEEGGPIEPSPTEPPVEPGPTEPPVEPSPTEPPKPEEEELF